MSKIIGWYEPNFESIRDVMRTLFKEGYYVETSTSDVDDLYDLIIKEDKPDILIIEPMGVGDGLSRLLRLSSDFKSNDEGEILLYSHLSLNRINKWGFKENHHFDAYRKKSLTSEGDLIAAINSICDKPE